MNFSCTLCGSRNWPRPDADCELCRGDEEERDLDSDYQNEKDLEEE